MVSQLHDRGEEFLVRAVFTQDITMPATLSVGIYDDSTDGLGETDDIGAVTTEPDTGNYARLSYSLGTEFTAAQNTAGDWGANFDEKTYDLTNTTGTADAYFFLVDFQGDGDTEATTHLIYSGRITDTSGNPISQDLGLTGSADFNGSFTFQ